MKTLIKTIALMSAAAALNANAAIEVAHNTQTSFEIGGTIDPECKINSTQGVNAASLDLSTANAQEIASVEIWCNTGQANASTTYTSLNNGVLENDTHNGEDIAYLLDIDQTQTGLSLTQAQTVSQSASTGVSGASTSRSVSIRPQINGFEYEGGYSDTISVTVALN